MAENTPDPNNPSKRRSSLLDFVGLTRFVMVLAVLSIFVGSATLLLIGTFETFSAIWHALGGHGEGVASTLRSHLIESVDTFLVAVVLYVIAIGLYQLFVNPNVMLPHWLRMREVGDLEKRLVGMSVSVTAVVFVTHAIQPTSADELLPLGLAIAAVIAAIALFLYQEGRSETRARKDE